MATHFGIHYSFLCLPVFALPFSGLLTRSSDTPPLTSRRLRLSIDLARIKLATANLNGNLSKV